MIKAYEQGHLAVVKLLLENGADEEQLKNLKIKWVLENIFQRQLIITTFTRDVTRGAAKETVSTNIFEGNL